MFLCLFIPPFSLLPPVWKSVFFSVANSRLQQRLRQQVETFFWCWSLVARTAAGDPAQWLQLRAGWLGPSPSRHLLGAQPAPLDPGSLPLPLSLLVGEEQSAASVALPKPLLGAC